MITRKQAIEQGFDKESYCYQCNETEWHRKDDPTYLRCPRCRNVLSWKPIDWLMPRCKDDGQGNV